jgi:hypothetical protein
MRRVILLTLFALLSFGNGRRRHGTVLKLRKPHQQGVRETDAPAVTQSSILRALAADADSERDLITSTSKKFASLSNKLKLILRQ